MGFIGTYARVYKIYIYHELICTIWLKIIREKNTKLLYNFNYCMTTGHIIWAEKWMHGETYPGYGASIKYYIIGRTWRNKYLV